MSLEPANRKWYRRGLWVLGALGIAACIKPLVIPKFAESMVLTIKTTDAGAIVGNVALGKVANNRAFAIRILANGLPLSGYEKMSTALPSQDFTASGLSSGTSYDFSAELYRVSDGISEVTKQASATTQSAWTTVYSGFTTAAFTSLGVASTDNHPLMSWATYFAAGSGNHKYLFGGISDFGGGAANSNLLWKLDAQDRWTPLTGTLGAVGDADNTEAVFGSAGVASLANTPPGLNGHYTDPIAVQNACVDPSGNFWIYGGISFGWAGQNTLWRFNEATGWTWMSGTANALNGYTDRSPVHGVQGVEGPAVDPGNRYSTNLFCGQDGLVYLFGGKIRVGVAGNTYFRHNTLFRFNPQSGQWAWLKGSVISGAGGTYGTKGVAAPANVPGARDSAGSCVHKDGTFWLFGGKGNANALTPGEGALSDVWRFDGTNWAWMGGSDLADVVADWGTKNVEAASNTPGGRQTPLFCGPGDNELTLAGGYPLTAVGNLYPGLPNGPQDVWRFSTTTGNFKWLHGHNSFASEATAKFGTAGIPAVDNLPVGGFYPSWMDSDGTLYLLGMWGSGSLMKWK